MMNNPDRLVLYAKDVALISDVTKRKDNTEDI